MNRNEFNTNSNKPIGGFGIWNFDSYFSEISELPNSRVFDFGGINRLGSTGVTGGNDVEN